MATTLHELVQENQAENKDKIAVVYDDEDVVSMVTYKELWEQALEMSRILRRLSSSYEVVGICATPSVQLPGILQGILSTPAAFYSVDIEGLMYAEHVIRFVGIRHILIDIALLQSMEMLLLTLNAEVVSDPWLAQNGFALFHLKSISVKKHECPHIAYVITTSGTTGRPKVVRVPHRCIVPNIVHLRDLFNLTSEDVVFQASPMTFDPSIVELFLALSVKAAILITPATVKMKPRSLAAMLTSRHKVTFLQATPTLLSRFDSITLRTRILKKDSPLKILAFGGEKCPSISVLRQWRADGNNTRIFNLYGTTEVSSWSTCYEISENDLRDPNFEIPIGTPLLDTKIELKSVEGLTCSKEKHLLIGGPTRWCLVDKESADTSQIMRATGDIVIVKEDGMLIYKGRQDSQVKRHGKRLDLDDVESIALSMSGITGCSAVLDGQRLLVFITPKDDQDIHLVEAVVHDVIMKAYPAQYHPDRVISIALFPVTKHGKIDKSELLKLASDKCDHSLPGRSIRQLVSKMWMDVLGFNNEINEVSDADLFINKGGNSFKAVQLMNSILSAIGISPSQPAMSESDGIYPSATGDEVEQSLTMQNHQPIRGNVPFAIMKSKSVRLSRADNMMHQLLEYILNRSFSDIVSYLSSSVNSEPDDVGTQKKMDNAEEALSNIENAAVMKHQMPLTQTNDTSLPMISDNKIVHDVIETDTTSDMHKDEQSCIMASKGHSLHNGVTLQMTADYVNLKCDSECSYKRDLTCKPMNDYPCKKTKKFACKAANVKDASWIKDANYDQIKSNNKIFTDTHNAADQLSSLSDRCLLCDKTSHNCDKSGLLEHKKLFLNKSGHEVMDACLCNKGECNNFHVTDTNSGTCSITDVCDRNVDKKQHIAESDTENILDANDRCLQCIEVGTNNDIGLVSWTSIKSNGNIAQPCSTAGVLTANFSEDFCICKDSMKEPQHITAISVHTHDLQTCGSSTTEDTPKSGCCKKERTSMQTFCKYATCCKNTCFALGRGNLCYQCDNNCCEDIEVRSPVWLAGQQRDVGSLVLRQGWAYDTGKCVDASPLLVLNSVSFPSGVVLIGSHSHRFSALNLETGDEFWSCILGGRVESSAAMSACGRYIVVGCYDHYIYFIALDTGNIAWKFKTGGPVKSSPCIDPMLSLVYCGSHDHKLFAFNVKHQKCVWQADLSGGSVFSSPCLAMDPHQIYVGTLSGFVCAIQPDAGRILWRHDCGKPVFTSPVVTGRGVCVGCVDGSVTHLTHSGNVIWKYCSAAPVFSSPVLISNIHQSKQRTVLSSNQSEQAMILFGSHDHNAYCLSETGELVWKFLTDSPVYSTIAGIKLHAQRQSDRTQLMAKQSKLLHSSFSKNVTEQKEISEVHDGVIICSSKGTIYLVNLFSGELITSVSLPSEVFSSPIVLGDVIIIGCRDDKVYSVEMVSHI